MTDQDVRRRAAATTRSEDLGMALLGVWLVAGVFLDGWAHANRPGLETFFTPWHAVLYSGAGVQLAALARLRARHGRIPAGYGGAVLGAPLFLLAGAGDLLWHQVLGVESGIDALLSPTHLALLASGLLVLSAPWRAGGLRGGATGPAAVLSLGLTSALVAFFLIYVSAFTDPLAAYPVTTIPHGQPGHLEGELPSVAGLAGYLVTTAVLVVPLLLLVRRGTVPTGAATAVLVGLVSLCAVVAELVQPLAPVAALLAGLGVEAVLRRTAGAPLLRRSLAVAVTVPAVLWPVQLLGVHVRQGVAWPVELWAGVVLASAGLAAGLAWLSTGPAGSGRDLRVLGQ